jgi:hypothetical protein
LGGITAQCWEEERPPPGFRVNKRNIRFIVSPEGTLLFGHSSLCGPRACPLPERIDLSYKLRSMGFKPSGSRAQVASARSRLSGLGFRV